MRLLSVTGDDDFTLVEFIHNIPRYAILSHTWGADENEVTFKDIYKGKGKGKNKPGYAKLTFCAAQAAKDRLRYFWVDTCCIDKSSSAELAEAINSMFKWYRDSAACYVYLSDVPGCNNSTSRGDKKPSIKNSRWFKRGWTLQELLAPEDVTFFSRYGTRIGDKSSLAKEIAHETTIPMAFFQNGSLSMSQYSVEERMNWAKSRRTKREEDAAYCLLGIFGVQMPLIYGEGRAKAFGRLRKEIQDVHGRLEPDWVDGLLKQYGLPPLQIPWGRIGQGVISFVKLMMLLCTTTITFLVIMYDLPLATWFLGLTVAATPLYLYNCTRWNRAENILVFSLVAGFCYMAGKTIRLQEEIQRLNDIVLDNAMLLGIDKQTMRTREIVRHVQKAAA